MKFASVLLVVGCLLSVAVAVQPGFDDGEFLIDTTGVHDEGDAAAAFDGANFLVVWTDWRGDPLEGDIYGARVTQQGTVLDPSGFVISQAAYGQSCSALGFDGANFLVVWEDCRRRFDLTDIYGARVTPGGVVLDPQGLVISQAANDQETPAVAFDGVNFLVAWTDQRSQYEHDIYGARVTPQGTVLDPSGVVISQVAEYQYSPAVAFDNASFLAVWTDQRRGGSTEDIYGARVTPQGTLLDPSGFAVSEAGLYQEVPVLGFDGANFLVVWQDWRGGEGDIYGARVTPQGTVLDPSGFVISQAEDDQESPAVAFDGANFLVVWEEYRGGWDIYGARVTPAGVVSDSGPVVSQGGGQYGPALARGTGNQLFLLYDGWAGTVGGKTYNATRVWGKMNPSPAVAEMTKPEVRMTNSGATVVRGILRLPANGEGRRAAGSLFDISGLLVMALRPGANDVARLAPGVYYVRSEPSAVGGEPSAVTVRKVVITR